MSKWSQSGGRSGRIKKVEDVKLVDQLVKELSQGNLSVRNIKEEEIDHKQCELHVSPKSQSQGLTSRRVTFASSTQTGRLAKVQRPARSSVGDQLCTYRRTQMIQQCRWLEEQDQVNDANSSFILINLQLGLSE